MAFLLKRQEDGKYVAYPGAAHSYVRDARDARRFQTREQAEANRCGNESVVEGKEPV